MVIPHACLVLASVDLGITRLLTAAGQASHGCAPDTFVVVLLIVSNQHAHAVSALSGPFGGFHTQGQQAQLHYFGVKTGHDSSASM